MERVGDERGNRSSETGPASAPEQYEPDPRRWRAFWVSLVAGFMSLLDVSIVAVALPSMQQGLGASPSTVQWVVSGYALTFGLALVPAGRLGDAFGRRRMFLGALAAFIVCSIAAGLAPTALTLVIARLLQGLAAGWLAPQNSGLIQQLFRGAERGRAFGFFGATVGISTAVGPVVGGVIIAIFGAEQGWRWIFLVNVPIGIGALILGAFLLPRTAPGRREHIDLVGVGLLGAGVLALMLPLVLAESRGLQRLWWLFPAGAGLIAGFAAWERHVVRRHRQPLLDPRLVTGTPGYATGASLGTVFFVGFSGVWLVFALFFQTGLHYSPLESGLAVTPFALGSSVAAALGGRLVERFGRRFPVAGLLGVIVGLGATAVILLLVPAGAAGFAVAPALLVGGIGSGFVISPNITLTLRDVPVRMAGSAGGALQTGQRFGTAVGTAALPALFYLVLAADGDNFRLGVATALGAALVFIVCALGIGVFELSRDGRKTSPEEVANHPQPATG